MNTTNSSQLDKFDGKALLIGIDEYMYSLTREHLRDHKVREIERFLKSPENGQYDPKNVVVLTNQKANREGILRALETWKYEANQTDTCLIYFSGCMFSKFIKGDRHIYFCPYELDPKDLFRSAILLEDFLNALSDLPTENLVIILDIRYPNVIDHTEDFHEWKLKLPDVLREKLETKIKWVLLYSFPLNKVDYTSPSIHMEHFPGNFLKAISESPKIREEQKVLILDVFCYLINAKNRDYQTVFISSPLELNPPVGFAREQRTPYYVRLITNVILILGLTSIYYLPFVQNIINPLPICVQPYVSAVSLALIFWVFLVIYHLILNRWLGQILSVFGFKIKLFAFLNDFRIWPKNALISGAIITLLVILVVFIGFTNNSPLLQTSHLTIHGFMFDNVFYPDGGIIHIQDKKLMSISALTSDSENTICSWTSESNSNSQNKLCDFSYLMPASVNQDTITLEASASCGVKRSNASVFIIQD